MKEKTTAERLKSLEKAIAQAESGKKQAAKGSKESERSGIGQALRIGIELVSALIVGVGIGLLFDSWLGTEPWGLVVFFFLGAAAGILNVYRSVSGVVFPVSDKEED